MSTIHHDEHPLDRAAMLAMRAMIALEGKASFVPAFRPTFDAIIARTPALEGVDFEAGAVGGVPGWWCRPKTPRGDAVILHHHGGGYVVGSAAAYRNYVGHIVAASGLPAFSADYALAPERRFPAAVDDAMAAYLGLVDAGFRRIALAGDSAGGGLTLALLANASRTDGIPAPLGAMAMSPWTDLALTGPSVEGRAADDPLLTRGALVDAADLYLGDRSRCDPAASPLYGDLADLPPIQVHVGEDEILLDDSLRYAERVESAGGGAEGHGWAGMPHVFPANVGTLKAAGEALGIAGAFLAELAAT